MKIPPGKAGDILLAACLTSVGVAVYLSARGAADAGIFAGLWAPAVLCLGPSLRRYRSPQSDRGEVDLGRQGPGGKRR
jgi:hypothetical protein